MEPNQLMAEYEYSAGRWQSEYNGSIVDLHTIVGDEKKVELEQNVNNLSFCSMMRGKVGPNCQLQVTLQPAALTDIWICLENLAHLYVTMNLIRPNTVERNFTFESGDFIGGK